MEDHPLGQIGETIVEGPNHTAIGKFALYLPAKDVQLHRLFRNLAPVRSKLDHSKVRIALLIHRCSLPQLRKVESGIVSFIDRGPLYPALLVKLVLYYLMVLLKPVASFLHHYRLEVPTVKDPLLLSGPHVQHLVYLGYLGEIRYLPVRIPQDLVYLDVIDLLGLASVNQFAYLIPRLAPHILREFINLSGILDEEVAFIRILLPVIDGDLSVSAYLGQEVAILNDQFLHQSGIGIDPIYLHRFITAGEVDGYDLFLAVTI